jgi:hypothetical protein
MATQSTTFVPPCTDYAERVRASFARQGAMRLVGATLVDVAPGYCALALVPREEVSQQHGYVPRACWRRWWIPPAAMPGSRCFRATRRS